MEFKINWARQESTKLSSLEIDMGRTTRKPLTKGIVDLISNIDSAKDFLERQEAFL